MLICFQSGRNIVPVRLFFDTDPPLPPLQVEDSFKRSVTAPSGSAKDSPVERNKLNIVDSTIAKEKKQEVHKVEISKQKLQPETKKALLVDSASFAPIAVNIIETTTLLSGEQVLLNGQTESAPEDVAGSGLPPPPTISEGNSEVHEELLSQQTQHAAEVVTTERQISSAFAPDLGSATTEDITRFDKMVKVEPAQMASTTPSIEHLLEVTSEKTEGSSE